MAPGLPPTAMSLRMPSFRPDRMSISRMLMPRHNDPPRYAEGLGGFAPAWRISHHDAVYSLSYANEGPIVPVFVGRKRFVSRGNKPIPSRINAEVRYHTELRWSPWTRFTMPQRMMP